VSAAEIEAMIAARGLVVRHQYPLWVVVAASEHGSMLGRGTGAAGDVLTRKDYPMSLFWFCPNGHPRIADASGWRFPALLPAAPKCPECAEELWPGGDGSCPCGAVKDAGHYADCAACGGFVAAKQPEEAA